MTLRLGLLCMTSSHMQHVSWWCDSPLFAAFSGLIVARSIHCQHGQKGPLGQTQPRTTAAHGHTVACCLCCDNNEERGRQLAADSLQHKGLREAPEEQQLSALAAHRCKQLAALPCKGKMDESPPMQHVYAYIGWPEDATTYTGDIRRRTLRQQLQGSHRDLCPAHILLVMSSHLALSSTSAAMSLQGGSRYALSLTSLRRM